MKFIVEIECGNAAFDDECGGDLHAETTDILFQLAEKIKNMATFSYLYDSNGNMVGQAEFVEDSDSKK